MVVTLPLGDPALPPRFWSKVTIANSGCWEWNAAKDRHGYGVIQMKSPDGQFRVRRAHRLIAEASLGDSIPLSIDIDHECRNRKCVNPSHLRTATRSQNNQNVSAPRRNNRTGFRGVRRVGNKFAAYYRGDKPQVHIGMFNTAEEAAEAARQARLSTYTHNEIDKTDRIQK